MNVDKQHIVKLQHLIEESITFQLRTSNDFEKLHDLMWERKHEAVGVSTLKRLWGYIDGYPNVRESTLNVLCRFVAYPDWRSFLADYCEVESVQTSCRVIGATVTSESLQSGDLVEIAWHPDRRLLLRHEGYGMFTVVKAENSKVKVGDSFHCERFMLGQPLYIDSLQQGAAAPTLFLLGKQGGLTHCCVTKQSGMASL